MKMTKIAALLLAVLAVMPMFGCEKEKEPTVYADLLSSYAIVRPDMAGEQLLDATEALYLALGQSEHLPKSDLVARAEGEKELIVGATIREESAAALEVLKNAYDYNPRDYRIEVTEDCIVVASESDTGAADGVRYLIENILPATPEEIPVGYTYTYRIAPAAEGEVPLKYGDKYLVWNDEFDTMNTDLWKMHQGGVSCWNYSENSEYGVIDGALYMNIPRHDEYPYNHSQPWITTIGTFCYNYGYLEARMKFPLKGTTPALWFFTQSNLKSEPYHIEVDAHESVNNASGYTCGIYKSWVPKNPDGSSGGTIFEHSANLSQVYLPEGAAFGDEWHIFGFGWDEEKMWATLDGDTVWTHYITEEYSWGELEGVAGLHEPMFILFSNICTDWDSNIQYSPPDTVSSFQVDYIRLYQSAYEGRAIWDAGLENWGRDYTIDMSEVQTQVDWEAVIAKADGQAK